MTDITQWEETFEIYKNKFTVYDKSLHNYVLDEVTLKSFIKEIISQTEEKVRRGYEDKSSDYRISRFSGGFIKIRGDKVVEFILDEDSINKSNE